MLAGPSTLTHAGHPPPSVTVHQRIDCRLAKVLTKCQAVRLTKIVSAALSIFKLTHCRGQRPLVSTASICYPAPMLVKPKNAAAVALGKLSMAKLTKRQRIAKARTAAVTRWAKTNGHAATG